MMKLVRRIGEPPSIDLGERVTAERCRQGDRRAIEHVFRANAVKLERLIGRLARSGDDVEDLLQSTFEAAISAFSRFRGEASLSTWLCSIAVRIVQNEHRRPERTRRAPLTVVDSDLSSDARPPDLAAADRRAARRVEEHLSAIAPKKRVAFVLQVLDGRPVAEVAALVGASETTTRSRVFWARRELMARLRADPELREWLEFGCADGSDRGNE